MIITTLSQNIDLLFIAKKLENYMTNVFKLPISHNFIENTLEEYVTIDKNYNLLVIPHKEENYQIIQKYLKGVLNLSFQNLINLSLNFSKSIELESQYTQLTNKIAELENEINIKNEIVEELRDSYIRLKRSSTKAI